MDVGARITLRVTKENYDILREISYLTRRSINEIINTLLTKNLPFELAKAKETK